MQSAENAQRAKKRYPNSIMLRSSVNNIDVLEVDEISAWRWLEYKSKGLVCNI